MRKGRPSFYRNKTEKFQVDLTKPHKRVLDAAAKRNGKSRADIVGRLLELHGKTVTF